MVMRPRLEVLGALADPTRLDLIERLQQGSALATTQLAQGTGITRQAIRKHLTVLEQAGLVTNRRVGRQRLWSLDPGPLAEVGDWASSIRSTWEARFDRLDAFLALDSPGDPDA